MHPKQSMDFGSRIIGIIRTFETVDLVQTCRALAEGGVNVLEITLNSPGALAAITAVKLELGNAIQIGAGTVLSREDAQRAIDAGAQFVVTPTFQKETIHYCVSRRATIISGAMTPTEIYQTHSEGADYVKLFPAGGLGIEFIKAVLGPLPMVRIVPTGGVSIENISDFLKICPAVGVASNLAVPALMADSKWDELTALASKFVAAATE